MVWSSVFPINQIKSWNDICEEANREWERETEFPALGFDMLGQHPWETFPNLRFFESTRWVSTESVVPTRSGTAAMSTANSKAADILFSRGWTVDERMSLHSCTLYCWSFIAVSWKVGTGSYDHIAFQFPPRKLSVRPTILWLNYNTHTD